MIRLRDQIVRSGGATEWREGAERFVGEPFSEIGDAFRPASCFRGGQCAVFRQFRKNPDSSGQKRGDSPLLSCPSLFVSALPPCAKPKSSFYKKLKVKINNCDTEQKRSIYETHFTDIDKKCRRFELIMFS